MRNSTRTGTIFERATLRTSYESRATSVYDIYSDVEYTHLDLIYEEVYFIKSSNKEHG